MEHKFNYTTLARRFKSRYPLLSSLLTHISFWVLVNAILGLIIFLYGRSLGTIYPVIAQQRLSPVLVISAILGFLYGVALGFADHYIAIFSFQKRSIVQIVLIKTVLSVGTLTTMLWLIMDKIHAFIFARLFQPQQLPGNNQFWHTILLMLVVYYLFMTLILNFAIQVNKKFGPGVLLPLLFGKYRSPKEEERIFMFMDLKSSTSIAESSGHLRYSAFIRDSFYDINQLIPRYHAEVYQYVGDEIVLSWTVAEGLRELACIQFFFACEKQFEDKARYYQQHYGRIPHFKAGLHMGIVVAVEIGEIKRDIAYHGDTLNTAARIQSLCNQYQKKLLVSEHTIHQFGNPDGFKTEMLGMVRLKGKVSPIGIISVEKFD